MWDVVGESGLFRLQGHKDQVTDVVREGRLRLGHAPNNHQHLQLLHRSHLT